MRFAAPPKFKILVANLKEGSDPSRIGGNPVKQRMGFVLQQMVLPDGTVRTNGPTQQPPAVSAVNHTAEIVVVSPGYWDPTIAAPGPFYYQEEARFCDQYAVAASDFGVGLGSGTGPAAAVAADLAAWVNACVDRVTATSVGASVYLTDARQDERFPVQATNDMSVLLPLGTFFQVFDSAGNLLSVPSSLRATFFIPKPVKSQFPPTIF
jgi:hypothetical protein